MNRFANNLPQEESDRLLFDYLEGSLSSAEEDMLEERLLSDSLLQEELDSWKESCVTQEFYPTAALEKRILANTPRPFNFHRIGAGTLLVAAIFGSLFFIWPSNEATDESQRPVSENSVTTGDRISATTKPIETAESEQVQKTPAPGLPAKPAVAAVVPTKSENAGLPTPVLQETLPVAVKREPEFGTNQTVLPEGPLKLEKVKIQASRAIFSISKKEQRKINRMKRKNQEKRMAREFMKGNRPYVVPLNTQNF